MKASLVFWLIWYLAVRCKTSSTSSQNGIISYNPCSFNACTNSSRLYSSAVLNARSGKCCSLLSWSAFFLRERFLDFINWPPSTSWEIFLETALTSMAVLVVVSLLMVPLLVLMIGNNLPEFVTFFASKWYLRQKRLVLKRLQTKSHLFWVEVLLKRNRFNDRFIALDQLWSRFIWRQLSENVCAIGSCIALWNWLSITTNDVSDQLINQPFVSDTQIETKIATNLPWWYLKTFALFRFSL